MGQNSKIRDFPDISSKLTAPTKKSVFERQKAEAEAKRQREQEETAAVYEDFVKSFDDADEKTSSSVSGGAGGTFGHSRGGGAMGGPSKRHFSGPPSGNASRGGLGVRGNSGPGSLGPPPLSHSRKRAYDGNFATQKEPGSGLFAFEDVSMGPTDTKAAFQLSDEEDVPGPARSHERAPPKPTLRLSSLPPGTSPAVVKAFIPANLTVDGVRILPPSGPVTAERRSLSAIVTLAKDTPALDIDTAVSALQNRYLGRGFYLTLSRHLSSVAIDTEPPALGLSAGSSSLPFGARPIPQYPGAGMGRGMPGSHRGGFAPPQSYAPTGAGQFGRGAPPVQVNVNPPSDLKQIKLIHKTLEALLTHGPEFEALLMSRRDVQLEEKWAWLWDSRSTGGVYYRWRLWDVLTGASWRGRGGGRRAYMPSQTIFEGGASWAAPEVGLPFEYTTRLEEFVSDSEYNSSDDDDSGDEGRRRYFHHHGGAPPPDVPNADAESQAYLNPLQKAKLIHLLARLPNTNSKLRKGDVARVTAFAIQHAGEGGEEVVQMIVSNVLNPYNSCRANPSFVPSEPVIRGDDEIGEDDKKTAEDQEDTSPSKLIALYLISDILSSSSTSGVRHAWRYRQLFESALKSHHVFEHLGRLEKSLRWGRLRAEKWRRSVGSVLALWEGWCVFPQAAQEHFVGVFEKPPLTREEDEKLREAEKSEKAAKEAKSRWKTVDEKAQEAEELERRKMEESAEALEDDDVDGEPMEDEDLDGEPMDEDLDGEPMPEDGDDEALDKGDEGRMIIEPTTSEIKSNAIESPPVKHKFPATKRQRPKAEDMFADSDGD